jgi:starch synthase (maltosyl-transferring)
VEAGTVEGKKITRPRTRRSKQVLLALPRPYFIFEDVYPSVDGGRYAVKRVVGEPIEVWADILRDGHDVLVATLLWRREGDTEWRREPMRLHANDRWSGTFVPALPGRYVYQIEAWTDEFATWQRDFGRKQKASAATKVDALEGALLIAAARTTNENDRDTLQNVRAAFEQLQDSAVLLTEEVTQAMTRCAPGVDVARSIEFPLIADRPRARASAWYELFPRSQSKMPGLHGTFRDVVEQLPRIAELGFDVLYFPPIHPIGRTNRKGRNNSVEAQAGDPGSPYAIGSEAGGHDAIHPELGTLDDFDSLVSACHEHGLEIALDFAVQCSPDHPWLRDHPEWFKRRADGSISYAENPPKKYEDIVNPDLRGPHAPEIWRALHDVIRFWIDHGVRIFRVDNPHTKPLPFWEWLIREIQTRDPEVLFLSEAFTRPKIMKALAKLGFTQSYTYFTWRTGKTEIEEYLKELAGYPEREYFRPNFFVNTPDILPVHLQTGERWIFQSRVALAAALSGNYGVYSGFELLESEPLPGREEYLDAEKYEIKTRDWEKKGNLGPYIARLNRLRRENPALLQTANLRFLLADHAQVIAFLKESVSRDNAVATAIALDGPAPREFWLHFGDNEIGSPGDRRPVREIENLFTGERHVIQWGGVGLRIDPASDPALLFRCFG